MKKLMIVFITMLALVRGAKADTVPPTTAPVNWQDVFLPTLTSHVVAANEIISNGTNKLIFTDSIILIGKYQGDYIAGLDLGFIGETGVALTSSPKTYGIHLHVLQFFAKYLNINPTYAPLLSQFEINPRYSFDTDVHHGVLGLTIGYAHSF